VDDAASVVWYAMSKQAGNEHEAVPRGRLSDLERAAMRSEWSLECRQIGGETM